MANTKHPETTSHVSDDSDAQALRQQVEHLRLTNQLLWALLADISRKMQVSSAAIKASVSSLLGYDIVLGLAAQHELLEVIEDSTDQVSKNITLLTLVSQIEAGTFFINTEPIEISEILSAVNELMSRTYPDLTINLGTQMPGRPVCVDYEFLSIALMMLFELLIQTQQPPQQLNITATESKTHCLIDVGSTKQEIYDTLSKVSESGTEVLLRDTAFLLPVRKLQLYVACKIFEQLSIQIESAPESEPEQSTGIRLLIPLAKKQDGTLNCE